MPGPLQKARPEGDQKNRCRGSLRDVGPDYRALPWPIVWAGCDAGTEGGAGGWPRGVVYGEAGYREGGSTPDSCQANAKPPVQYPPGSRAAHTCPEGRVAPHPNFYLPLGCQEQQLHLGRAGPSLKLDRIPLPGGGGGSIHAGRASTPRMFSVQSRLFPSTDTPSSLFWSLAKSTSCCDSTPPRGKG